ncbi:LAQU0S01e07866g1_1 [Lachancea quebecensis]|uniref:LAQU0S01e07866g1_1 n=1 Tax=Lachancea quebecensis TaxID=1654605 RepID=A0A0N7MKV0_9SACH|nr:LAQU0S01e07866g1_1 [Lachancea quebecensis]
MSFLDAISRPGTKAHRSNGTLDELLSELTHSINELQKKNGLLGTRRDSQELRHSVETELVPQCETLRDRIEQVVSDDYSNGKLATDFASLKGELIRSKRQFSELKSRFPLRKAQRPSSNSVVSQNSGYVSMPVAIAEESTPLLQDQGDRGRQQQLQENQRPSVSQDELNFHTLIQQERSEEISRIHTAVQEVNAIFHQLGSLVREQGEDVDNIDNNISGLAGNLQRANEQLGKADQSQRKKNRCGIITLVIIVVIVLVVVLAALS